MTVRTNVFALNAQRQLGLQGANLRKASQRLSSGFRINSAADDAAGLAISEAMRAQIRGLDQAAVNAQDAVGLISTAEGAMSTVNEMVTRVRELVVQAANDTLTYENRALIQAEIDQLLQEVNDIAFRTQFNTRALLDGGISGGGGQASPVSLQWMLFEQIRIIEELRGSIADLQREVGELARRVGDTQPNRRDMQEMQRLQSHTESVLRRSYLAAADVYDITQGQINGLGGASATNGDGSNVFMRGAVNAWNDADTGGLATLAGIRYAIVGSGTLKEPQGYLGALRGITDIAALEELLAGMSYVGDITPTVAISPMSSPPFDYLTIDAGNIGLGGGSWNFEGGVLTINNVARADGIRIDGASLSGLNSIVVAPGTNLAGPGRGLVIDSVHLSTGASAALDMRDATVDLWLEGNNVAMTSNDFLAGIETTGGTLRINGNGSLIAGNSGAGFGAGIGGFSGANGGNIIIDGGNIMAQSIVGAAIGNGAGGTVTGGTIEINGGVVMAITMTGADTGLGGAAIGGGAFNSPDSIVINGGLIDAQAGSGAAIGSGEATPLTDDMNITINGGLVRPYTESGGAGLGGGLNSGGGTIAINGGIVDIANGFLGSTGTSTDHGTTTLGGGWMLTGHEITSAVNENGVPVYRLTAWGIDDFAPHEIVEVTVDGETHHAMADMNGELRLFLPEGTTGEIRIIRGDYEYAGQISIETHHDNVVTMNPEPLPPAMPVIAGSAQRTGREAVQINVTTDTPGRFYRIARPAGEPPPTLAELLAAPFSVTPDYDATFGVEVGEGEYVVYVVLAVVPATPILPPIPISNVLALSVPPYAGVAPAPENFFRELEDLLQMAKNVLASVKIEATAMWFQLGANAMQGFMLQMRGMHTGVLGGSHGDLALLIDIREESGIPISRQIKILDEAGRVINTQRAQLGAAQNRLEFTRQNLANTSENLSESESRVRDADLAREKMRFTQAQILQQAGIAKLAQANQQPATILQLLNS